MKKKYIAGCLCAALICMLLGACSKDASNEPETFENTSAVSTEAVNESVANRAEDEQDSGAVPDSGAVSDSGAAPEDTQETDGADAAGTQSVGIMGQFQTADMDGNTVGPEIFEDYKLTMINVWATYCGYCIQEMPDLAQLGEEYADSGFQVVGFVTDVISSDGSLDEGMLETAADMAKNAGADYIHLVPSVDLYGLLSQISSLPTTFFVDSEGRQVGSAYLGARDKETWQSIIEEALKLVE